jgi:hypothetical protein
VCVCVLCVCDCVCVCGGVLVVLASSGISNTMKLTGVLSALASTGSLLLLEVGESQSTVEQTKNSPTWNDQSKQTR